MYKLSNFLDVTNSAFNFSLLRLKKRKKNYCWEKTEETLANMQKIAVEENFLLVFFASPYALQETIGKTKKIQAV